LARAQLGVDCRHWGKTAEGTIGMPEPANSSLAIAEVFISQRRPSFDTEAPRPEKKGAVRITAEARNHLLRFDISEVDPQKVLGSANLRSFFYLRGTRG
jgi:hypothetical protein